MRTRGTAAPRARGFGGQPFPTWSGCSCGPVGWLLTSINSTATTARSRLAARGREDRGNCTTKAFTRGGRPARPRIRTVTLNLHLMLQPPHSPQRSPPSEMRGEKRRPRPILLGSTPRPTRRPPTHLRPPPLSPPHLPAHLRPPARVPAVPRSAAVPSRAGKLPGGAQREARARGWRAASGVPLPPAQQRTPSRLGRSPRSPPLLVTASAARRGGTRARRPPPSCSRHL